MTALEPDRIDAPDADMSGVSDPDDNVEDAGDGRIAVANPSRVAITGQPQSALSVSTAQKDYTPEQYAILAARGIKQLKDDPKGFPPGVFLDLLYQQQTTGADALRGEVVPMRVYRPLEGGGYRVEFPLIVTFRFMHGLAEGTSELVRLGAPEFLVGVDDDGEEVWTRTWTAEGAVPKAARIIVERRGRTPEPVTVYWDEVCPKVPVIEVRGKKRYRTGALKPPIEWEQKPITMFSKCVRAAGLRIAFPDVVGGLYVSEEMQRAKVETEQIEHETAQSGRRTDLREAVAALTRAGRGDAQPTVLAGEVVGENNHGVVGLRVDEQTRITRAQDTAAAAAENAAAVAGGLADTDEQQRQAWLWEEISEAAEVMGVPLDRFTARHEAMWAQPLAEWTPERMRAFIGPLRPAVAARMAAASRVDEARAYREAGPNLIAPIDTLYGRNPA